MTMTMLMNRKRKRKPISPETTSNPLRETGEEPEQEPEEPKPMTRKRKKEKKWKRKKMRRRNRSSHSITHLMVVVHREGKDLGVPPRRRRSSEESEALVPARVVRFLCELRERERRE
jgi:hypothetical protein